LIHFEIDGLSDIYIIASKGSLDAASKDNKAIYFPTIISFMKANKGYYNQKSYNLNKIKHTIITGRESILKYLYKNNPDNDNDIYLWDIECTIVPFIGEIDDIDDRGEWYNVEKIGYEKYKDELNESIQACHKSIKKYERKLELAEKFLK
jgi:hypothetical protein